MDMDFTITGADSLTKKLLSGGAVGAQEMDKALSASALQIKKLAIMSISRGGRSGRIYRQNRSGGTHQAAGPGEPPKTQSGLLVSQITQEKVSPTEHNVGSRSRAPHGAWQEYGTSKMPAHPWLRPAFQASKAFISDRLKVALQNVAKRMRDGR